MPAKTHTPSVSQPLPPRGRFCDLVLQGGVVSGIVYPPAIARLAESYWFKNLGGTSVGALAAAVTAAAEFGRRRTAAAGPSAPPYTGFVRLGELPAALAESRGDGTVLQSLFQPAPKLKRLFSLFLRIGKLSAAQAEQRNTVWPVLWAVLMSYRGPIALAFFATLLLIFGLAKAVQAPSSWAVSTLTLVLAVVAAVIGLGRAVYRDLTVHLVANNFGICRLGESGSQWSDAPALTQWLHTNLQALAGLHEDRPLTFADLWGAPGGPDAPPGGLRPEDKQSITLRMVTTNLTLGRPFTLPLAAGEERLFYRPDELASYFPASVMAWVNAKSRPYKVHDDLSDPPAGFLTEGYFELPSGDMPVVVAARLSLSFPLLISAVPLHAIDREPRERLCRTLQRCWFSDGGICSNFPIHWFDHPLPRWPTFGIALTARSPHREDQPVWLPQYHQQGRGDSWEGRDDTSRPAFGRLLGFAASILASAKNWNDRTLQRMPGVRDRVVRVAMADDESETNIGMSGEEIRGMAERYGRRAGNALVEKFLLEDVSDGTAAGWREHRWVRFQTLAAGMSEWMHNFAAGAGTSPDPGGPNRSSLADMIARAFVTPPLRGRLPSEAPLNARQADSLDRIQAAMQALETALTEAAQTPQPYRPEPAGQMRVRPPL